MSDQGGPIDVSTKEIHRTFDRDPSGLRSGAPPWSDGPSLDERLDALMETVRTWDWRARSVERGRPRHDSSADISTPPYWSASVEVGEGSVTSLAPDRAASESIPSAQLVVHEPRPRHARIDPPSPPPMPPEILHDPIEREASWFSPIASPRLHGEAQAEAALSNEQPRRFSRIKMAVLCLAAIAAVGLIIGGLRFFAKSSNSSDGSFTQSTASAGHGGHPAAMVSAAQLTQFKEYADSLQKANGIAARAFIGTDAKPTQAQVAAAVTSYRSAVNLYGNQLHTISWPTSMQTAIDVEYAQEEALVSFLQLYSSVSPTGVSAWLTQLHNRTGTMQSADNQVRQYLGLPSTASFP